MNRIYRGGSDPSNGGIWFEESIPQVNVKPSPVLCYEEPYGIHRPWYSFWSLSASIAYFVRNIFGVAS